MAEERKPLTAFKARRAQNGGWIIYEDMGDLGGFPISHAYTSDRDMLAALPELIGAKKPADDMSEIDRIMRGITKCNRQRADDAVEATKADMAKKTDVAGDFYRSGMKVVDEVRAQWPSGETTRSPFVGAGDGNTRVGE
jgi:hypothetical protein